MIYDLAQPLYNNSPQYPGQPHNAVRYFNLVAVEGANVERVELMTHSGTHVDAPFHFLSNMPTISELPLQHFFGSCVAVDLRPLQPGHGIVADDLRKHEARITEGVFVLLKTGWGDRRANSREFLTAWPYVTGDGAQYLLDRGVKGMGIDGMSTGGCSDKHAEADAHLLLLGQNKLLLEDIQIPDALLDGKRRFFAALPILIANASGAWTRPIVWDAGDLESPQAAPEYPAHIPASVAALIQLERSE